MKNVIERHIRISERRYYLFNYLNELPKNSVTDEIYNLLEIGLLMRNSNFQNTPITQNVQTQIKEPEFEIVKVNEDEPKIDDFDISDAFYSAQD